MRWLSGGERADEILGDLRERLAALTSRSITPGLGVVIVGRDPGSILFVRIKERRAAELGFYRAVIRLSEQATERQVVDAVRKLARDPKIHGLIVQLPLPAHLAADRILVAIPEEKDVDNLRQTNRYPSPAAEAVLELLRFYGITLREKRIVIVGYGRLVGQPLAHLLESHGFSPEVVGRQTANLASVTRKADILISATGVEQLITKTMVKPGAVVIAAAPDVAPDVAQVASAMTPPRGGIGPLTVALLLRNVAEAASRQSPRRT